MFTSTRSPSLPTSLSLQLIYRQVSSLLSVIVSNSSSPIHTATRTRSRCAKKMDVDFIDSLGPEFNEIKELVKRVVSIESKVLALHRVLTGPIQKTYPDDAKISFTMPSSANSRCSTDTGRVGRHLSSIFLAPRRLNMYVNSRLMFTFLSL